MTEMIQQRFIQTDDLKYSLHRCLRTTNEEGVKSPFSQVVLKMTGLDSGGGGELWYLSLHPPHVHV